MCWLQDIFMEIAGSDYVFHLSIDILSIYRMAFIFGIQVMIIVKRFFQWHNAMTLTINLFEAPSGDHKSMKENRR